MNTERIAAVQKQLQARAEEAAAYGHVGFAHDFQVLADALKDAMGDGDGD